MILCIQCRDLWKILLVSNFEMNWPNAKAAKLVRTFCDIKVDTSHFPLSSLAVQLYIHMGYWGQDGWILAQFFFCVSMDQDTNLQKEERDQYPAILTEQTWSIKDLLYGFWENFSWGIQRVVLTGQDGSILPTWVANHIAWFGSSCPLAELAIQ